LHAQLAKPPVAPVKPVIDTYFGEKVEDPYRYMEDQKDPAVVAWMKAQADYTRALLDSMRGRKAVSYTHLDVYKRQQRRVCRLD